MKKTLLILCLMTTSFVLNAQNNKNLDKFYDLLTAKNLDVERNSMVSRDGSIITLKYYSYSKIEYSFIKFDVTNLERVEWITKEDYDAVYPDDAATSSDAKHITIYLKEGSVERDTYWASNDKKEYIGEYGEKNLVSKCTNCNFVNFNFINSDLASKAKKFLDAYQKELKK